MYAILLVFSLVLASIAFLAYRQSSSPKILLVAIAFVMFATKAVILSVQVFVDLLSQDDLWLVSSLLDVGIVATIFFATLKS